VRQALGWYLGIDVLVRQKKTSLASKLAAKYGRSFSERNLYRASLLAETCKVWDKSVLFYKTHD